MRSYRGTLIHTAHMRNLRIALAAGVLTIGLAAIGSAAEAPWQLRSIGADEPVAAGRTIAPVAVIDTGVALRPALRIPLTQVGGRGSYQSHGSMMALAVAGPEGSASGVPVIAYNCDDGSGLIDVSCGQDALADAARRGARVALMSWSSGPDSAALDAETRGDFQKAVNDAAAQGLLVVAAAGIGGGPAYPASLEGVLSVGAADVDGQPLFADAPADVLAPGEAISALDGAGERHLEQGSSFAAAYAAGVAARLVGLRPGVSAADLKSLIRSSSLRGVISYPRARVALGVAASAGAARPRAAAIPGLVARPGASGLTLRAKHASRVSLQLDLRQTHWVCSSLPCRLPLAGALPKRLRVTIVAPGRAPRAQWVPVRG